MAVAFFSVVWTDENGITTYLYPETIEVHRGMQSKKSQATVRLPLGFDDATIPPYFDDDGKLSFKVRETMTFYAGYSSDAATANATYILLSGEISELAPTFNQNELLVKFSLIDKSTALLDKMIYVNLNDTTDNMVKTVVKKASENKSNEGAFGSGNESYDISVTNVNTTNSLGEAFPTKTFSSRYKPAYQMLEELSQIEYTGDDKPYYFWVDANNNFYWKYPSGTTDATIDTTSSDDVVEESFSKNEDDAVNFIIFNAGKDKNDNGILFYDYNEETDVAALKMAYKDWSEIANAEMRDDLNFDWAGSTNTQVRTEAKNRGVARCQALFSKSGQLKWKGKCVLRGDKSWNPGQLIDYTSTKCGIINQKLRVTDVTQSLNSKGWYTTLELEEDWKAMVVT